MTIGSPRHRQIPAFALHTYDRIVVDLSEAIWGKLGRNVPGTVSVIAVDMHDGLVWITTRDDGDGETRRHPTRRTFPVDSTDILTVIPAGT